MASIGIFFGTQTGNTERIAGMIAEELEDLKPEVINIANADEAKVLSFDVIFIGIPTWNEGELQEDWIKFEPKMSGMDWKGKSVAIFGLGDYEGYADTYQDGMGILAAPVKAGGGKIVGITSTDGYEFSGSKAVMDGKFCGLCLDEDNEADKTEGRVEKWCVQLRKEMGWADKPVKEQAEKKAEAPAAAAAPAVEAPVAGARVVRSGPMPIPVSPAPRVLPKKAAAKAKPKPPAKGKEPEKLPPPPQLVSRRKFFTWGFGAWLVFFAWLASTAHLFLRFMFPRVLYEPDPKFRAGKKEDFPEKGKVYELFKENKAVWLVRLEENGEDHLVALSTVCTHLGCTPNWLEAEAKFKCPCHGSGFYSTGVNFEGPAPRPLERFRIYTDAAGDIIVDKASKFRQDLAQWGLPESYIKMA